MAEKSSTDEKPHPAGEVPQSSSNRRPRGGVCESQARLEEKTVIITGANTGIGKETAIDLARRGAKVIIGCRNEEKATIALADIKVQAKSELVFFKKLDLASLASVHEFASSINATEDRLDILINNAGVMMCPYTLTEDGFEMQFGVNHLGHFLLTNLLLDLLKKSSPSRIINVSSKAHSFGSINFDDMQSKRSYSPMKAYSQSKLANVLFTRELHRRLEGFGVSVYAIHPGIVATEIGRHSLDRSALLRIIMMPLRFFAGKNAVEGAQTSIYCAVEEGIENLSGKYFVDCKVAQESTAARNDDFAKRLWELSEELVKL